MKNFQILHSFVQGLQTDFDDNAESDKSIQKGVNGRLYSENGMIAYSDVKGTVEIYRDPGIVKYLGYWAFEDELILFIKAMPTIVPDQSQITWIDVTRLTATSFTAVIPFGQTTSSVDFNSNVSSVVYQVPVLEQAEEPLTFGDNIACVPSSADSVDMTEYFTQNYEFEDFAACPANTSNESFENNAEFLDCVLSLKKDSAGQVYGTVVWIGMQNWPMDAKMCTYGISENNFYKRVYYTNYVNAFRMINVKDSKISSRRSSEFSLFQGSAMLQPKIINTTNSGQIKAGTVMYSYRLYTENGQATTFSPFSAPKKIVADQDGFDFEGGDVSEVTTTSVVVKCNLLSFENFSEIECVAIEYEAKGVPTAIRSLGIKPVAAVVIFEHFGNEAEFSNEITISDLTKRSGNFKYCSDLDSAGNKMYVAGLRNDPLPISLSKITEDFALHGWDAAGETHTCLLNPEPWKYRYVDPNSAGRQYYIKQKLYNSIQIFSSATVKLVNKLTNQFIHLDIVNPQLTYVNHNEIIWEWLQAQQLLPGFTAKFPDLKIEFIQNKIVFYPIAPDVDNLETDMNNYVFEFSTTQIIEDVEKDVRFINLTVNPSSLIYGGVSLGFNTGNGIRITYQTELEEVLTQATQPYENGPILNMPAPNLIKSFMKGEIYRLSLQAFKEGEELFAVPIGDLFIPEHGELKKGLDNTGTPFYSLEHYANSRVIGNKLYAEKIKMRVEVRLSCELQKFVKTYQIAFVERTENNRTILAQGLASPMERVQPYFHSEHIQINPTIAQKWALPYFGGPTYDGFGLNQYDSDPENESPGYETPFQRVVTHRAMFNFDSPDFIYDQLSTTLIKNAKVKRVARLNTDHDKFDIRNTGPELYPKFSRKIFADDLDFDDSDRPKWVNVSVFSKERVGLPDAISISHAEKLLPGELMAGFKMGSQFDVSNNAMTLGRPAWFYSINARSSIVCGADDGAKYEIFNSNNYSVGRSTVIIRTEQDVFTDEFISAAGFKPGSESGNGGNVIATYDTYALINLELNNRVSVYGGRSELAYSKNVYVPLSETIPVVSESNATQVFSMYGDTYVTLHVRNKNHFADTETVEKKMNNSSGCGNAGEHDERNRTGAWSYAAVIETMLEPRLTHQDTFWKQTGSFQFDGLPEIINEAYFQEHGLKNYLAKPYKFRDDPNLNNIVAVSDIKTSGSYIDQWSVFRINNFYELEKDKGTAFNLAKYLDQIFVIQEFQESRLDINPRVTIPSTEGGISVQQGTGEGIVAHEVISDYGTSIRRAVVPIMSSSKKIQGFTFFDERRIEFVRVDTPMLIEKHLHLSMRKLFEKDPITDVEGYFDDEYKETNLRIRTKNENNFVLSFNEIMQVFNGTIEYDNDIYMVWNKSVYAPVVTQEAYLDGFRPGSAQLDELNKGEYLKFFGKKKTLKLGITINFAESNSLIFLSWAAKMNTNYPIKTIRIKTSSGQTRIIQGSHYRYKIREGIHNVPLKNRTDWDDLRGQHAYLEIEVENNCNKKIDIFGFINFVRNSFL